MKLIPAALLGALFLVPSVTLATQYDLHATQVPNVDDWTSEAAARKSPPFPDCNTTGNYAMNDVTGSGVFLEAVVWSGLALAPNEKIVSVVINVRGRYDEGSSHNYVTAQVSGSVPTVPQDCAEFSQGDDNCQWLFNPGWDITGLRASWSASDVASLHIAVRRHNGTDPVSPNHCRIQAFRIRVNTVFCVNQAPTSLVATAGCGTVGVSWTGVPNADSYHVYRDGAFYSGAVGTGFTDGNPGTAAHLYEVAGYTNACASEGPRSIGVVGGALLPPPAPGAPTVSNATSCGIFLSWPSVSGATSYQVYRDGLPLGSTPFTVEFDKPGPGTHCYRIAASNACGTGALSPQACGSPTYEPGAALAVSVTSPTPSICPGQMVRFDILVENRGPCRLDGVRVVDLQDAGWEFGEEHTFPQVDVGGLPGWEIGSLERCERRQISVSAELLTCSVPPDSPANRFRADGFGSVPECTAGALATATNQATALCTGTQLCHQVIVDRPFAIGCETVDPKVTVRILNCGSVEYRITLFIEPVLTGLTTMAGPIRRDFDDVPAGGVVVEQIPLPCAPGFVGPVSYSLRTECFATGACDHTSSQEGDWSLVTTECLASPCNLVAVDPPADSTFTGPPVELLPASPNPFEHSVSLGFVVRRRDGERVRIGIYDVAGRRIISLVDGPQTAGSHRLAWDGRDEGGRRVSSGAYFVRSFAGDLALPNTRIVLLRP